MRVLVFAPHPDDDLIGCGGSIAKHVSSGRDVCIAYMTSGNAGSLTIDKKSLAEIREEEARNASELLGVKELIFLRHDDGYLSDSPELSNRLINLIRDQRPDIIYIPHPQDGHPDHKATYHLVTKAAGQAAGPWFQGTQGSPWAVPTILAYEVWTPIQEVVYLEDITAFREVVGMALRCHKSQLEDIDYEAMSLGLANYRGSMLAAGRLAEAFVIVRAPNSLFTALE